MGRRFLVEWFVVALLTLTLVGGLVATGGAGRLDGLFYDAAVRLSGRPTPSDVVVVAIDERSLEAVGRWPWPRTVHAALLDRLAAADPKAIVYDVLFVEPRPGEDERLARAMRISGRVYVPLLLTTPGMNGAGYRALAPVEPVRSAAAGVAQVNVHPDRDGIVRRAWLGATGDDGRTFPHLVQLVADRLGAPGRDPGGGRIERGALHLQHEVLVPFAGPAGRIRTVSAIDLLRGETPEAFLRGKTVFVGATAVGLGDRFPTPVGELSGVELQAGLLDGMLHGRLVRPAPPILAWLFSLFPAVVVLAAFVMLRPRTNLWVGALLLLFAPVVSGAALAGPHVWIPPAAAMAGVAFAFPLWGWRRLAASSAYMVEELERLRLEPALLTPTHTPAAGDIVERQLQLMRDAVGRTRDLRRFMTDALEGLPDPTLVVGLDGRVLMASAAASRVWPHLGTRDMPELDEVLATVSPTDPDQGPARFDGLEGAVVIGPDARCYALHRSPILAHDGGQVGWIVRFGDITAIRAAQQQREEVLQLLSHDMRAPQASILALLDGGGSALRRKDAAARIRALARRTLDLADGFVRLARAEAAPLDRRPVNLNDLLVEAADELWPLARSRSVQVEVDTAADEVLADVDAALVSRALFNLVCNAIEHTPEGGRVTCSAAVEADEVRLVVSDEGPGLALEITDALFGRFGTGRPGLGGIGLGLALVRTVALRHGGGVEAETLQTGGARFSVRLPRRRRAG